MKTTLVILISLLSNFVSAQTLTKYVDNTQSDGYGFAYNVTVKISLLSMAAGNKSTEYQVELIRVEVDKNKGWYESGQTYNCAQLENICNTKTYNQISLQLTYICQGKELETNSATFYNIGEKQIISVSPKSVGGSSCSTPTANGIGYVSIGQNETIKNVGNILQKLKAGNNSNNNQNSSNNSSPSKSSTNTDNQPTINPNDPNPMTNGTNGNYQAGKSEFQKNYETGQQLGELTNNIIDIFSPSPEKLAREEAERKLKDAEKTEDLESFKKSLSFYIEGASNGNERERMKLIDLLIYYNYYKGRDYRAYIPEYKNWLFEAANNKSLKAMNIIGWESINLLGTSGRLDFGMTREQAISILEESADLGSINAMILLGKYYEWNKCLGNLGGNDPDKALKWFNMAAQNNSPSGYYHLGMIHSYPKGRSCLVNYKIKKNYLLAKEYFLKASELEESESLIVYNLNAKSSSYRELYFIYNEGRGCDKNSELAKKYLNLYRN